MQVWPRFNKVCYMNEIKNSNTPLRILPRFNNNYFCNLLCTLLLLLKIVILLCEYYLDLTRYVIWMKLKIVILFCEYYLDLITIISAIISRSCFCICLNYNVVDVQIPPFLFYNVFFCTKRDVVNALSLHGHFLKS